MEIGQRFFGDWRKLLGEREIFMERGVSMVGIEARRQGPRGSQKDGVRKMEMKMEGAKVVVRGVGRCGCGGAVSMMRTDAGTSGQRDPDVPGSPGGGGNREGHLDLRGSSAGLRYSIRHGPMP